MKTPRKTKAAKKAQPVADLIDVAQSLNAMYAAQADAFAAIQTLDAAVAAMSAEPAISPEVAAILDEADAVIAEANELIARQNIDATLASLSADQKPVADQKPLAPRLFALAFQLIIVCVALALRGLVGLVRNHAPRLVRAGIAATSHQYAPIYMALVFAPIIGAQIAALLLVRR